MLQKIEKLADISRKFGSDSEYVLAGGGNTSCKDENFLYVKPSGISLADIKSEDFIKINRNKLNSIFKIPDNLSSDERESFAKTIMADAIEGNCSARASVEAPLHNLLPYNFVVHTHPALVNGMTCGLKGAEFAKELFPNYLWVDYIDPGYTLAKKLSEIINSYIEKNINIPKAIFLQNHGIFVSADTIEEINEIYSNVMNTLKNVYEINNISTSLDIDSSVDSHFISNTAPILRTLLSKNAKRVHIESSSYFPVAEGPLTPDHIVYSKSYAYSGALDNKLFAEFESKHKYKPLILDIDKKAIFSSGSSLKEISTSMLLAKDASRVAKLTEAFGGARFLNNKEREFIENWEVESYRKSVSSGAALSGRLEGKISLITGGAQGFGYGISHALVTEGATVIIADINLDGAQQAADKINNEFSALKAIAVQVDISSENSVEKMMSEVAQRCGGLDIFVANAGVLKAGSVKTLDKKDWDFVTNVNYSGYFICVKYASKLMSKQNIDGFNSDWTDIIQVNSKSGLVGSLRNGAYAGSKFGTIGLTQSFALELIEDQIKVNSICPGNFFDGPLWSDPDRGLFVQYLNSNKVPGAKTVEDVKSYYENKVPMKRGCTPLDVARAIFYIVEQTYETGQAIPVTGGQVMLN